MATSYDYVDEFTKQLARKRRLAELLQQQSMSGLQLANPHARASWLNALVPLAQAWAGKSISDESNAEGTAHEKELAQQMEERLANAPQPTPSTPAHPDMNLPGDLRAYAGQDYPEAAGPTTRPSTDVQSPLLPPSQQPQNPMAQLLAGSATPTLGDKLAADQGQPTAAPKDLTSMLPGTVEPAGAPPLVPTPVNMNFAGTPAQKAQLEALAKADMAKSGQVPGEITRGPVAPPEIPPMPPQAPAPPPSLAGPSVPGAVPPPNTPPPTMIPPPPQQVLQGSAPRMPGMLPAQPGRTPNSFDFVDLANQLPPGSQQAQFMQKALDTMLTEPGRLEAKRQHDEMIAAITGKKIEGAGERADTRAGALRDVANIGAGSREKVADIGAASREKVAGIGATSREKVAELRGSGGGLQDQTPEQRAATAAMVRTGVPLSQAVPGWGTLGTLERRQARNDAIQQIMTEENLSPQEAGIKLANNEIDYLAGRRSITQLNTMLGSTRPAVEQLDFNIRKATEEMDKLPSSDLSPIINAIARGAEKWTGDPAYSSLFFYMNAAAMESARIIQGGQASIAQLHQGAAEEARNWANVNMTPASWKQGVAPAMLAEGQNRIETFEKAKKAQKVGVSGGTKATEPAPA